MGRLSQGKLVAQSLAQRSQGRSIGSCVRNEEDDATIRVVASLQIDASFQRLPVRDRGFGLDPHAPDRRIPAGDLCIPGSEVTFEPERHFSSPTKGGMQSRSQSFQQGQLRTVTNGIAYGISAECEIEAHHRTPAADLSDRNALQEATFEAP
jgi:hypothetical protein